jgi:hypothetical protein
VLFNACAADLWRRFTTYLLRQLARRLDITQKDLRALARIRFVKVAEYQARGVVHFHAVIRLDAPGEDYQAPPPGITADTLCDAIGLAGAAAAVVIEHQDQAVRLGFGTQTDTRIIRHGHDLPGTGQALNGAAVANYIAKYATKTLTAPGLPSCRIRSDANIERLRCPAHYRRLITTAWQLGTVTATPSRNAPSSRTRTSSPRWERASSATCQPMTSTDGLPIWRRSSAPVRCGKSGRF